MWKEMICYNQSRSYGGGSKDYKGQRDNRDYQSRQQPQHPKFQFDVSFFNQNGTLNTVWLDEKIESLSQALNMSNSQLRNFFNEFQRIQNIPDTGTEEKIALIKLLKAKAKYKATNTRDFSPLFVLFIDKLVAEIGTDLNKFNKACLIMEALIGFSKK